MPQDEVLCGLFSFVRWRARLGCRLPAEAERAGASPDFLPIRRHSETAFGQSSNAYNNSLHSEFARL